MASTKSGSKKRAAASSSGGTIAGAYLALSGLIVSLAIVGSGLMYQQLYDGRIFLGVSAMGIELGGYTAADARKALAAQFERYLNAPVVVTDGTRHWQATPRELGLRVDVDSTVQSAFAVGRAGSPIERLRVLVGGLSGSYNLARPGLSVDSDRKAAFLRTLAKDVDRPAGSAQLVLKPGQKVVILPSQPGKRLNVEKTGALLDDAFESLSSGPIGVVVEEMRPAVGEGDLDAMRSLVERMVGSPLALTHNEKTWTLEGTDLAGLIELKPVSADGLTRYDIVVDDAGLKTRVEKIAKEVNTTAQNARFALKNGKVVAERPSVDGQQVDVGATLAAIKAKLPTDQRTIPLVVKVLPATVPSSYAETLKFPDLLEQSSTVYGGTLPDRMFNVELAAQRLNGTIIMPGETFSFNDAVGEVSFRSGYKKGYGISQDGDDVVTIPSEGGGICQVATTVFQAAFWAGMPVVERNWHLYWIPRYGQMPKGMKGLDATIDQIYDKNGKLLYEVDLLWKNTTSAPVLLEMATDGKDVTAQLWGVKMGWKVSATTPKIEKVVKADQKPVYQSDPSLARGAQLMIEHAEDGFQATTVRTVTLDGKTVHEQRFVSTYRPSRNVYLVGGPVQTTPVAKDRPANPGTPQPGAGARATPPAETKPTAPKTPVAIPPKTAAPTVATPAPRTTPSAPAAVPSTAATPRAASTPASTPATGAPAPSPTPRR